MIKHVGRHNSKKVVIAYRQVPDEDHMALVIYSESLPSLIHDELMKILESDAGQSTKDLADVLFRHIMADGTNCLTHIHKAGYLKKVPTNQVIVTPNSTSTIRLDELNKILTGLEQGEEAAQKMAEIAKGQAAGIDGGRELGRELGEPSKKAKTKPSSVNTSTDVLSDADIAAQRLDQAARMEAEAKGLLAEAKRLKEEAKSLVPAKAKNVRKSTTTKKATA